MVVGDVGEIMEALDKQMVSGLSLSFRGILPWLHAINSRFSFSYANLE